MLEEVVKQLIKKNKTIATMESCTGGGLANEITNIPGASKVLNFSAVTYSNKFKENLGVSKEIINKYTVYSIETAREMAKQIVKDAGSDYGVGITGKLNKRDPKNPYGIDNEVFASIYDKSNNKFYDLDIFVEGSTRRQNKKEVILKIKDKLLEILK